MTVELVGATCGSWRSLRDYTVNGNSDVPFRTPRTTSSVKLTLSTSATWEWWKELHFTPRFTGYRVHPHLFRGRTRRLGHGKP